MSKSTCNHCAGRRLKSSAGSLRAARRMRAPKGESSWRTEHDVISKARMRLRKARRLVNGE